MSIRKSFSNLALTSLLALTLHATAQANPAPRNQNNVILITLDGVRWREVFEGDDPYWGGSKQTIFTNLLGNLLPGGVIFGDVNQGTAMEVSNGMAISMPGYQSIMAGYAQSGCITNGCGRITVETFPERIVRDLGLPRSQVATFGSWNVIREAVEHVEGATFANSGNTPVTDLTQDIELEEINRGQNLDLPPWHDSRLDKYTWAHSMRYLQIHRPRFLFIALNDSDEWAHAANYPKHLETLRTYDQWIRDLFDRLDQMGEYGKSTTVIITTDHGRGEGRNWQHHSFLFPSSKNVWLYARSPKTLKQPQMGRGGYSHVDIRPTIEMTFGLRPMHCQGCGRVMTEIAP